MAAKLTAARRRGLEVIARRDRGGKHTFRSNTTHAETGYVYWQTVDWLVDNGYAKRHGAGQYLVTLTAKGRDLAHAEGLL